MGKYDSFIDMAGPAPKATAPQQDSTDAQAPAQQQPSGGKYDGVINMAPAQNDSQPDSSLSWEDVKPGFDSSHPIQQSPLGIMQRAMLGWVRTPQEQQKYLAQNFDDVKPISTPSGGQSFAVKQKGQWFDVNPDMEWSPTLANAQNALGKIAQDTGEYGVRGAAAMEAGAPMATAGAEMGAPLGPIGAFAGGLAGLAVGGAAGATAAEGADLASRQALMSDGAPGKTPYNADEVNKQLVATAMWGAKTAIIGKSLDLGASAVADKFGQLVKYMTNSSPDGASAVKSFLTTLGMNDNLVEARLANPAQNAGLDKVAAQDAKASYRQGTPKLDTIQENAVDGIHDDLKVAMKKQGAEFDRLRSVAKDSNNFDVSQPIAKAVSDLKDAQILTPKLQVVPNRVVGEGDQAGIDWLTNNLPNSSGITYDESRARVQDLNNLIGNSQGNIQRILIQARDGLHENIAKGLDDISDGTGQQYSDIINSYSNSKMMKDALDSATAGNKRYTFVNKLLKENPNATKSIIGDMIDNGIGTDNVTKVLQAEGSRQAQSWFSGKVMGFPAPGPKVGAAVISGGSEAADAVSQLAAPVTPYLQKAVSWMKGLDGATRQAITTNPKALQAIQGIIGGAAQGEPATTNSLLTNAGVTSPQGPGGQ